MTPNTHIKFKAFSLALLLSVSPIFTPAEAMEEDNEQEKTSFSRHHRHNDEIKKQEKGKEKIKEEEEEGPTKTKEQNNSILDYRELLPLELIERVGMYCAFNSDTVSKNDLSQEDEKTGDLLVRHNTIANLTTPYVMQYLISPGQIWQNAMRLPVYLSVSGEIEDEDEDEDEISNLILPKMKDFEAYGTILKKMDCFKKLSLHMLLLDEFVPLQLTDVVENICTHLKDTTIEELEFWDVRVPADYFLENLWPHIGQIKTLKRLSLGVESGEKDIEFTHRIFQDNLFDLFQGMAKARLPLEHFELGGVLLTKKAAARLALFIAGTHSMKSVKLDHVGLSAEGLEDLIFATERHENFEKLKIRYSNDQTEEDPEELKKLVEGNKKIKWIN